MTGHARRVLLILVAGGLLAAAVPAGAQDGGPPSADALEVDSIGNSSNQEPYGRSGAVFEIRGSFPEGLEVGHVTAHIGPREAMVLHVTEEAIRILTADQTPTGTHDVILRVGGDEVDADLEVEILDEEEFGERVGESEAGTESGGTGGQQPQALLSVEARVGSARGMPRIIVSGSVVRLPDGCMVEIKLEFFRTEVQTIQAEVEEQRFEATFGPFEKPLPAGPYRVLALFDAQLQPRIVQQAFVQTFPDENERRQYMRLSAETACLNPSPANYEAEMEAELEQARSRYATRVQRARDLLEDLEDAYRAALKSTFVGEDGSFDEEGYREAMARFYPSMAEPQREAKVDELLYDQRFTDPDQQFRPAAWREWLDDGWRPDVISLATDHRDWVDRWVVVRHDDAATHLSRALGVLFAISQEWSSRLYVRNDLDTPTEDRQPEGAEMLEIPPNRRKNYFLTLLDRVERDLRINRYRRE